MKLFMKNVGNATINISGVNVEFIGGIAEVEDDFGKEALNLGIPDLFEDGKQPTYEPTSREVKMQAGFEQQSEFMQEEIIRLKNIIQSQKEKILELEVEIGNWKFEYQKEHTLRKQLLENGIAQSDTNTETDNVADGTEAPTSEKGGDNEDDELRKELKSMKKSELISFGIESGLDMSEHEDKSKGEIIEFLINANK